MIDGQQRVTALLTALLGNQVITRDYRRARISIAFHPGEERFEVTNAAIQRDRGWITDIASVFAPEAWMTKIVEEYCDANPDYSKREINERMRKLSGIRQNALGLIELNAELDVDAVAEIFVRINSQGVTLNEADLAMSKMAANEQYDGHLLRKCVDYFCHLAVAPEAYGDLARDHDFVSTDYFRAMEWLKDEL